VVDQNESDGMMALCQYLFEGRTVLRDQRFVMNWFRWALNRKIPEKQYRLGHCLETALSYSNDNVKAICLFQLANNAGHARIINKSGQTCEFWHEVNESVINNVKYEQLSSDLVYLEGIFNFGDMHDSAHMSIRMCGREFACNDSLRKQSLK
jgi:TPR repeat protein